MSGRQGGKLKPLKAPKKQKDEFEDDEDASYKAKQRADAQAKKDMVAKAQGGMLGKGMKKSKK